MCGSRGWISQHRCHTARVHHVGNRWNDLGARGTGRSDELSSRLGRQILVDRDRGCPLGRIPDWRDLAQESTVGREACFRFGKHEVRNPRVDGDVDRRRRWRIPPERDGCAAGQSQHDHACSGNETAAAPRLRRDQVVDAQVAQRLDLAMVACRGYVDDVWNGDHLTASCNRRANAGRRVLQRDAVSRRDRERVRRGAVRFGMRFAVANLVADDRRGERAAR